MARNSNPSRKGQPQQRAPEQRQAAWAQAERDHRRETALCGSLSLLTGAAVGAALMYAFDPQAGKQRRHAAYETTSDALESASETLGDAYHSASGSVGHALQHLGERVSGAASSAVENIPSAQDASDAAQGLFHRAANRAGDYRDS